MKNVLTNQQRQSTEQHFENYLEKLQYSEKCYTRLNTKSIYTRVPTVLIKKISRTFPGLSRTPETSFQDPVVCQ